MILLLFLGATILNEDEEERKMGGEKRILKYLMLKDSVQVTDLTLEFELEKSEVEDAIKKINSSFKKDVIFYQRDGVYMTENSKMLCYKTLLKGEKLFSHYEFRERYYLLIIVLAVENKYLSLLELADICLVSKNTILNDLKCMKRDISKKGIEIDYSRKHGYSIKGSEFTIRNILVSAVKNILHSQAGRILLEENSLIKESEIFRLRKRLERLETRIGFRLTDEQLDELPYIIQLVLRRAKKFNQSWSFKIEKYDIKNTIEFPEIQKMFWDFDYLSQSDLLYLSLQVLASNMVESALEITDGDQVAIAAEEFLQNIETNLVMKIHRRNELKEKILLHVRPAIYRNLLGFQINNPLTEEFLSQYQEIYEVVKKSVTPFQKITQKELSKEEIVYLSMIVLGLIYETEETEAIYKAVVLCQSGTSISKLLLVNLKSMFPEIYFIGAYSVRQFEQNNLDVDFIFTTVPVKHKTSTFIIPPILDKQDRLELKERVQCEMLGNNDKMVQSVMRAIKPYISEQHIETVYKKVGDLLSNPYTSSSNEDLNNEKKLFRFSIDNISIINEEISWEQLVDISMKPLLRRKSVTAAYIEETKKAFYANYDKMIIAQNVYLPHFSPENGVNRMDFQVLVFKNPTFTPNGEKVSIVVALAPSVTNEHVPTLIKLNNIFSDEKTLAQIINEKSIFVTENILNEKGAEQNCEL